MEGTVYGLPKWLVDVCLNYMDSYDSRLLTDSRLLNIFCFTLASEEHLILCYLGGVVEQSHLTMAYNVGWHVF